MIGRSWWVVVGLVAALSVLQHNSALLLLALFLAVLGGASRLWTRFCMAGVTYRRRFASARLFQGEETELQVEIVNAKPLPLTWLRARDEFPADVQLLTGTLQPGYPVERRLLVSLLALRWYERVVRRYRVRAVQRGMWEFGPVELISGDLFGLDSRRTVLPEKQTLLVYPRLVPIAALGFAAHHPFGDLTAARHLAEDPLRVAGARPYQPGDSFRHIHWRATARACAGPNLQGKMPLPLQTRVFEPSATRPLALFLNVNTYEFIYEGLDGEMEEFAITAAASIARYACEQGQPVGLYANTVDRATGQRIAIRPGSRPEQLVRILEALARAVDYGRWEIAALLQAECGALPYGATIVAVTPWLTAQLAETLAGLARRGFAVTLVALGAARPAGSLSGVRCYYLGAHKEWRELASLDLAPARAATRSEV